MSYKALLFCPDEKTARVVTQVLSELEFRVEPCNEPFAAVKKLMAEHFDAIVVDCDNEQNAALLFKSAHNSGSNQASLAVAVVEGQAGVAKAFRIGANLVLTKPINVEQSKGTLRVARGLLRKSDAAKPAISAPPAKPLPRPLITSADTGRTSAPEASGPKSARVFLPAPPPSPIPAMSSSVLDVEEDPTPKLEPTEAALLESMRDPAESKHQSAEPAATSTTAKQYPWQPISKPMAGPMATALQHAAEAAGKSEVDAHVAPAEPAHVSDSAMGRSFTTTASSASGQAAATAPAKEPVKADKFEEIHPAEAPTFSSLDTAAEPPSGSNKIILIAAVIVVAAVAGYFGWTKIHPATGVLPTTQKLTTPAQSVPLQSVPAQSAPAPAQTPAATTVPQSQIPAQQKAIASTPSQPTVPAEKESGIVPSGVPSGVAPSAPVTKKLASIVAPNTIVRTPVDSADSSPAPLVVKNQAPAPVETNPAPQESAQPPAANLLGDASNSNAQAISGIVSTPAVSLPSQVQAVKVSQGVSQGLLIKNVQPVYPALARQMRIQGAVQLLANVSKTGDITGVKLISGDSALAHAAIDAVKKWKYKPYYLDGQPVEIQTQVTVNFSLP
jgi:periplasmic protein TonB